MRTRLRVSPQTLSRIDTIIGAVFCAVLAAGSVAMLPRNEHRALLPLLFIVVIAAMAKRYGAGAGVLGSVAAALIFSYFWFAPQGSFKVAQDTARSNLSWMLILGISVSYFLSFPKPETTEHKNLSEGSAPATDRQAA